MDRRALLFHRLAWYGNSLCRLDLLRSNTCGGAYGSLTRIFRSHKADASAVVLIRSAAERIASWHVRVARQIAPPALVALLS